MFPFVLEGSVAIDGSTDMADEVVSGGTHIFQFSSSREVGRKVLLLSAGEKVRSFELLLLKYLHRSIPIGYLTGAFWLFREYRVPAPHV
jgi:hypothetical protein